jgi:hypothetical protein
LNTCTAEKTGLIWNSHETIPRNAMSIAREKAPWRKYGALQTISSRYHTNGHPLQALQHATLPIQHRHLEIQLLAVPLQNYGSDYSAPTFAAPHLQCQMNASSESDDLAMFPYRGHPGMLQNKIDRIAYIV